MDSLYDPNVGASVMSKNLASTLLGEEPLVPTKKFLKLPSGELVESCGCYYLVTPSGNDPQAHGYW